jgi:hypothetical protein
VADDGAARWRPRAAVGRVGEAVDIGGGCGGGEHVQFEGGGRRWWSDPTAMWQTRDGSRLRVTLKFYLPSSIRTHFLYGLD